MDARAAVAEHVAWVLEAVRAPEAWAALAAHHGLPHAPAGPDGARAVLHRVCEALAPHADAETRAWLATVPDAVAAQLAPPSPVASIFANARRTARRWDTWERRVNVACPSCGAAQERAREFTCRYCGSTLFPEGT